MSHVKVSNAWKNLVSGTAVKVSGSWKDVQEIHVKVGGAWKLAWSAATLNLDGHAITALVNDPANATAGLRIDDDGNVYANLGSGFVQIDSAADWLRPTSGAPGDYEVRYTGFSGDALTSSTVAEDVWHPLDTGDFTLTLFQGTVGSKSNSFTIEIREGSTGSALVSASYSLTAEVDSGV